MRDLVLALGATALVLSAASPTLAGVAAPATASMITAAAEPVGPPTPEPVEDMTVDALIATITAVVKDWRTAGWLAGLVALINLLLQLLRLPVLDRLLDRLGMKWAKPAGAAVLGGFLTALLAYKDGGSLVGAALSGALFGLSATGLYELVTQPLAALKGRERLPPGPRR
jgi:MFS family permease